MPDLPGNREPPSHPPVSNRKRNRRFWRTFFSHPYRELSLIPVGKRPNHNKTSFRFSSSKTHPETGASVDVPILGIVDASILAVGFSEMMNVSFLTHSSVIIETRFPPPPLQCHNNRKIILKDRISGSRKPPGPRLSSLFSSPPRKFDRNMRCRLHIFGNSGGLFWR